MKILLRSCLLPGLKLKSGWLVPKPLHCELGRISLAGMIHNGRGLPDRPMRKLGAYAIVHLLHGAGRYRDENNLSIPLQTGDVIIIFPDIAHTYGPSPNELWSELYFIFDGPVFDAWRKSGLLDPARPVLQAKPLDYWMGRWKAVTSPGRGALETVCALQLALADLLAAQSRRNTTDQEYAWIKRARLLMAKLSLHDQADWDAIANKMGLSYAGFRKRFTKLTGVTPGTYLETRRLDRATELLFKPGVGLKQIARESGFCDEFHFSRRFKKHTGLSPRAYRLLGQE